MSERIMGKVKWFNSERGYGFILDENDDTVEYFVHYSSVEMKGFKKLVEDQVVSFVVENTERGIQAKEVRIES
jgi:CspA family cold shock protein